MADPIQAPAKVRAVYSGRFFAVVAASLILRIVLVCRGGEFFWNDEIRFTTAQGAAKAILSGHFGDGMRLLFASADHLLFKVLAVLPALVQVHWQTAPCVPALFMAAASAWVVAMVGVVAAAAGGDEPEVFLATLLTACTSCLFYYARHFFPYDLSLGFMLTGLAVALKSPGGFGGALKAGTWVSLGFLTYNGYWALGGTVLIVHTLTPWRNLRDASWRAAGGMVGLVSPIVLTLVIGKLIGSDLLKNAVAFSGTLNEGTFYIGWRLIPEYLFVTEHALMLVWVAALAFALYQQFSGQASLRIKTWLALIVTLSAFLIGLSDIVAKFPIAARYIRILAPFLCLLTASIATPLWARANLKNRWLGTVLGLILVAQAAWNFREPLAQVFPNQFVIEARAKMAGLLASDLGPYELVNATYLHDPRWIAPSSDAGVVLLRRDHPYHFRPFLYEGYTETERREFSKGDLSMRLVRLAAGGPAFAGYPGPITLTMGLQKQDFGFYPEPIIATGAPGAGDLLYLRREDAAHDPSLVTVRFSDSGGASYISAPLHLDLDQRHTFVVSMGSLLPAKGDGSYTPHPEWAALKNRLYVKVDDTVALNMAVAFHEAPSTTITLGMNFVDPSSAITQYSVPISGWSRVPAADALALVAQGYPQAGNLPPFHSYPGAVRLNVTLTPSTGGVVTEPLLSTGTNGAGDIVFLAYGTSADGQATAKVGFDHWGAGAIYSSAFPFDRSAPHAIVISLGSLYPEQNPQPAQAADWKTAKETVLVSVDGVTQLSRPAQFFPSEPIDIVVGGNPISASSTSMSLREDQLSLERVPLREVAGEIEAAYVEMFGKRAVPAPAALGGYPGPLEIQFSLPEDQADYQSVPLLASGVAGKGDVIYLRFAKPGVDPSLVVIGHDHWGTAGQESTALQLDRGTAHTLTVSMASLYPPTGDRIYRAHPSWEDLITRVYVALDGVVMIDESVPAYPAAASTISIGASSLGASTSVAHFNGNIVSVRSIDPDRWIRVLKDPTGSSLP